MGACPSSAEAHLVCWRTVVYHPPKPQYQPAALLDHIEAGVGAVTAACPSATIVLAADFNMSDETESIVDRQTRGTNILDRIDVNNPCYDTITVVNSAVKSDHKVVVSYPGLASLQPLDK